MNLFYNQVITILTTPPGILVYHLLLILSLAGALQGLYSLNRSGGSPIILRSIACIGFLILLQIILFMLNLLGWLNFIELNRFLPPLVRGLMVLSLIWIGILWIFPDPSKKPLVLGLISSLLVTFFLVTSIISWYFNSNGGYFNKSFLDILWQILSLVIISSALILLFLRKPNGFKFGVGTFTLAGISHLLYLATPLSYGDYPGLIHLGQLAFFPIMLAIPQTLSPMGENEEPREGKEPIPLKQQEFSNDSKTFSSLLNHVNNIERDQIGIGIVRGVSKAMLADLCLLIILKDQDLLFECGYDLIRISSLKGRLLIKIRFLSSQIP